jgi:hypothetical protein
MNHSVSHVGRTTLTSIVVAVVLGTITTPTVVNAGEAGIDGDHIYAGVSYDSYQHYERCEWVSPSTIHQEGVSPSVLTREWNGIFWQLFECQHDGESSMVWLPEISTESVAESNRNVVRDLLPTLAPGFSPSIDRGLVKTPTWFWVNPLIWRPVSVTARVPTPRGIISVTTTATPESLEFHPGDDRGEVVECDGPGLPWSAVLSRFIGTDCQYEYPVPSSVRQEGTFRARLDVVWSVTWSTNVGAGGRLPDLRLGSVHSLRVRELHAVVQR